MAHANHHDEEKKHSHTIDPSILSTKKGIWATKWSFIVLFAGATLQLLVVFFSGSIALLADTIHNYADAATALPLIAAFLLARRKPSKRFTYGLGRVEDIAGVIIVFIILASTIAIGYESFYRLLHPQKVHFLWAVAIASLIGFISNEAVAMFRVKVGKEIGSAALIADGYHARSDGYTSLAVLAGAIGVWLGFPLADPIIGLGIAIMIIPIVWESSKTVFIRLLDGIEPATVDEITHTAIHVDGVNGVEDVRARWFGHWLRAEMTINVEPTKTVHQSHAIAAKVKEEILEHIKNIRDVTIHVHGAEKTTPHHHA